MAGKVAAVAKKAPASKPRKTQLQRKEEAKADIIKASFICFGKYGYQNTSLQKIAAQAGCSKELPRYHFGSKDELVRHLLNITAQDWSLLFDSPAKQDIFGKQAFDLIFKNFAAIFDNDAEVLHGQLALILGASEPLNLPLREQVILFGHALRASAKNTLRQGLPVKHQVSEKELDDLTRFILSASRGVAFQWLLDEASTDIEMMFKQLTEMVALKLAAITKSAKKPKSSKRSLSKRNNKS